MMLAFCYFLAAAGFVLMLVVGIMSTPKDDE